MKCPHAFFVDPPKKEGVAEYHTWVDGPDGPYPINGILVPCGKCLICRANKASEWGMRLNHQAHVAKTACFITLTYDDLHLPYSEFALPTLCKKDLQLFWKRFRKEIGTKIKYFAVGEYGTQQKRPHYHAIIFDWSPLHGDLVPLSNDYFTHEMLTGIWKCGMVQVGSVTSDSIHYVSGYLLKKMFDERVELGLKKREFLCASQGLGLDYAILEKEKLKSGNLTVDGKSCPIPRYYFKKLADDVKGDQVYVHRQIEAHYAVLRRLKNQNKLSDHDLKDFMHLESLVKSARQQNEKELRLKLVRSKREL